MWAVGFLDNLVVEALGGDDAGVHQTVIEHPLGEVGLEGAEDVASAEMNPLRCGERLLSHGGTVILGEGVARLSPGGAVFQARFSELHLIGRLKVKA